MSIVLFILDEQPPDLIEGYDDFLLLCSEYIGYGSDPDLWTTQQRAELDRRVQEAYRYVMYPATIPGDRVSHVWTFLQQVTTLTTVADDYDYTMPADFGSMRGKFTYAEGSGYGAVAPTSEQIIREARAFATVTGRPRASALRWRAQTAGLNQRQEVLLHPTPDAAYVLTYPYAVLVSKLSKINPYPLGGPRMSQLVVEAVKAVGEAVKNGARGDQWGVFREEMLSAVAMDRGTNVAPTVGMMKPVTGGGGGYDLSISSVDYYYGPSESYGSTLYQVES